MAANSQLGGIGNSSNSKLGAGGQQQQQQAQLSSVQLAHHQLGVSASSSSSSAPQSFVGSNSQPRSGGTPRNRQGLKPQHKATKRHNRGAVANDEDVITEAAVMRSINGRKGQTSITHLMNFSLPPRPTYNSQRDPHYRGGPGPRRHTTYGLGSGHHAVDKARYVHANYRFIVDPKREYHAQSIDADEYLDWDSILQILASPRSQAASCPICLGDAVAPRMAKCGHIFCLHCLIRYMHSTDESSEGSGEKRSRWKSCPLCWDSIYISDMRPVRWYSGQEGEAPVEGGDIVLRLVMRPAGSTLALPKEVSQSMGRHEEIPWHFAADVMDYARVMRGTEDYMLQSFDEELEQLQALQTHDELMFGEDSEWTTRAMRAVRDAKEKLRGIGNPPRAIRKPGETKPKRHNAGVVAEGETEAHSTTTDNTVSALSTSLAEFKAAQSGHQPHSTPSDYYFYQALLHYYLSPLDIRILRTAFGEFASFPTTILPRIERISTGHVIDDDLRRRAKYLAHLPHGCEVSFLECDWTDTVDAATLAKFKPDIDKRRRRNVDKDTREEKERLKAEERERQERLAQARGGASSSKRPDGLDMFRPDDFAPLGSSLGAGSSTTPPTGTGSQTYTAESSSPPWGSADHGFNRHRHGSAFASLASPSTSPGTPIAGKTVWGTSAVLASPPMSVADASVAPVDDGWLQGWEAELAAEDELDVARAMMASSSLTADAVNGESSSARIEDAKGGQASSKKKKKQGKKITLMSTTARRGA